MPLPDLRGNWDSKRDKTVDVGHGLGQGEEVPIEGSKIVHNFAVSKGQKT